MDARAAQKELVAVTEVLLDNQPLTSEVGWQLVSLVRATLDALQFEQLRRREREQLWSSQQQQLAELRRQRDLFREVLDGLGQGLAVSDAAGRFVYVNAAYARMLGYPAEELIGTTPSAAMLESHGQLFAQSFARGTAGEATTYETYLRRADGHQIYVLMTSVSRWHDDQMVGNVSLVVDLTDRKRKEEEREQLIAQLEMLAAIDELTGVYNRRYVFALGDHELKRARRYRRPLAVIMLDIDHFKLVNDTYGHAAGDGVLRAIAERCREGIRESDVLGRYGGEEFVIVVQEADRAAARLVAERLRESIALHPIHIGNRSVPITVSLGVAQMHAEADTMHSLVGRADTALYHAKQAGRNRVVVC